MHTHSSSHRRLRSILLGPALVVLVLLGCSAADSAAGPPDRGSTTTAQPGGYALSATEESVPRPSDSHDSAVTARTGADDRSVRNDPPPEFPSGIVPVRIEIPAIGVDAPVIDLDLRGETPEVPQDFADTGWYEQTRLPGEIGPAVIAGHVDSVDGPAVFARLSLLKPGDEIVVTGADGEQRGFVVVGAGQYPKTELPDEVFGFGEPVPELRLITCGGTFDRSVRHYVDNFVVYAVSNSQSPSAL